MNCTNISNIDFRSAEKIGANAFASCESLENAYFGEGLVELDQRSFYKCNGLKEVEFADGSMMGKSISEEAFRGSGIQKLVIGEGCRTIESKAFYECDSLKKIVMPDSLREIKDLAFASVGSNCLSSLELGNGLKSIGN